MPRKDDRIGPYILIEKLGRGSFGVVWLAEKRTALSVTQVALKLPNDDDVDLDAIKREAALWVTVSGHPNVLSIIEADIYEDHVIIVSEYAPGGSLAQWLKQNGGCAPSIEKAIEMMTGILSGLEHLHSKQIIHRDLKPANILLQGNTPRLVDFGLARVMKSTSHSRTVSGTYAYMPPEAFEGLRSVQTDLWSAGVIFHEMLTGELPYPSDSEASLIAAILTKEPLRLPESFGEPLVNWVNRALQVDSVKRFESASEMRMALRDVDFIHTRESRETPKVSVESQSPFIVSDESVETVERVSVKSNPTEPSPTINAEVLNPQKQENQLKPTALLDEIFMPTVASKTEEIRATTQEREKQSDIKQTTPSPTINAVALSVQEQTGRVAETKKSGGGADTLAVPYKEPPVVAKTEKLKSGYIKGLIFGVSALLLLFALVAVVIFYFAIGRHWLKGTTTDNTKPTPSSGGTLSQVSGKPLGTLMTESNVYEVAISADGKLAASVGDDNNVRLWRVTESNLPVALSGHGKTVRTVAISPDGQTVASGSDDKTVRLWRTSDGELIRELTGHNEWIFRVAFSPDGERLASASGDKTILLWNVADGSMSDKLNVPDVTELIVNLSPDLKLVAFYHPQTKKVRVWSVTDDKLVSELQGDKFEVHGGAFSDDNKTFALGSKDGVIRIYQVSDGKLISSLRGKQGETGSVVYNHNGHVIAAGYEDGQICLWRTSDGQLLKTLKGHTKFIYALAFSSDNRVLASGGEDKTLRLWEIAGK
jgi:serine/threonine protein kinase